MITSIRLGMKNSVLKERKLILSQNNHISHRDPAGRDPENGRQSGYKTARYVRHSAEGGNTARDGELKRLNWL